MLLVALLGSLLVRTVLTICLPKQAASEVTSIKNRKYRTAREELIEKVGSFLGFSELELVLLN